MEYSLLKFQTTQKELCARSAGQKAVMLLVKRGKSDRAVRVARIFVHFSPVLVKTTTSKMINFNRVGENNWFDRFISTFNRGIVNRGINRFSGTPFYPSISYPENKKFNRRLTSNPRIV